MILYTSMPQELIYPQDNQEFNKQMTVDIEGGQLLLEEISPTEYRVVRLMSSDPMLFLNENYSPGKMIQLSPKLT
ncbi:YlzJ-like family protein [Anaerobacillus sp. MEB173]|uniref:YlzJ-like family protein n=1 Tax=Anaerobacillus sp. MEB173 TaxID=3383345 RepID=UPI003F8E11F1